MARTTRLLPAGAIVLTLITGCGGGHAAPGAKPGSPGGAGTAAIPAPPPTGRPADAAAVRVIRAWADALRRGDLAAAGRLFALPSRVYIGPDTNRKQPILTLRTRAQAEWIGIELPCGAEFISADQRGPYVNALFRLTDRVGLGAGCGTGTGATARTNFLIRGGLIAGWYRAPDEAGDTKSGVSRAL